jgi:hypothetical protein
MKQPESTSILSRLSRFSHTKAGVSLMTLAGSLLLVGSFFFPYWNLNLKAPQYPGGLNVSVYMDHVSGDVSEVNLLNHYVGMGHLDESAQFERRFAWDALIVLAFGAMLVIPVGRKAYKAFYLPPVLFLLGFVGDLFYWLHRAGHALNPDAPVHIKPFTPMLIGSGKIGQFYTSAMFGSGFWMALAATGLFFYAIGRKKPICQGCPNAAGCRIVCDRPASWLSLPRPERSASGVRDAPVKP